MPLKLAEITVFLVAFLFFFFGLFLFTFRKGNRLIKSLLGLFFWALGFSVLDIYLSANGFYLRHPEFAYIINYFPFTYGPLLFLLTNSVTKPNYSIGRKEYLHFLPLILAVVIFFLVYHIHDFEHKQTFLKKSMAAELPSQLISITVFISIIFYIIFSIRKVNLYRIEIKESVSNVDRINLGWLYHTLIGFSGILVLSIFVQIATNFNPNGMWLYIFLFLLLIGMLVFIMSSIVRGLKSDVLFDDYSPENDIYATKGKIQIDQEKIESLKHYFQKEKPFLNPNINLGELAKTLNLTSRELSQIINHGFGKSFFDMINEHRIKYSQEMFTKSEDEKLTILEVMYASGFNSKSSFNTAFKKHTGNTPSNWKKKNLSK